MGQNPHHNTGERWFQMEPNFCWPTHHHQALFVLYFQPGRVFICLRSSREVGWCQTIIGLRWSLAMTSVLCMLMTGYSLHWWPVSWLLWQHGSVQWTQTRGMYSDQAGPRLPAHSRHSPDWLPLTFTRHMWPEAYLLSTKINWLKRPVFRCFWPNYSAKNQLWSLW